MEKDVQELESESQKLLEYLEGNQEPSEPDDIEDIDRAVHSLIDSVEEFTDQAEEVRSEFIELGLAEQAEALQDVTTEFSQLPPAIRSSLLDNQLLFVLKAQYFPAAASEEISEYVNRLDAMDPQGRQNTIGAMALIASSTPEAVVEYIDEFARRLPDAPRAEKQNMLGILILATQEDSAPNSAAVDEALELIHSDDETIVLYAAMLLGNYATTERQAELVSRRIADLLGTVEEPEARINATSVLCGLAESYPDQVRDLVPNVAALLEEQHPSLQNNVIEFLELTGADAYRSQISDVHARTDDEDVREAAESALDTLSEDDSSSGEGASATDTATSDSLLDQIEDEFKQL